MSALTVITLAEAKTALAVDFPDHDVLITQCIETAVELVEKKTQHYLYERTELVYMRGHNELYHYPVKVNSVVNEDAVSVEYKVHPFTLYSKVKTYTDEPATLNLTVGYATPDLIPNGLKMACMKLVVYLFENRDIQTVEMPTDVYMLLRPYVRYATI